MMKMNKSTYGRRMEIRRAEIGFSQVDLAKKIGTTRQCISNYEAGQRKPDIDMLVKIAKALNTSTDYLLGLTGGSSINADTDCAECKSQEGILLERFLKDIKESNCRIIKDDLVPLIKKEIGRLSTDTDISHLTMHFSKEDKNNA